MSPLLYSGPAWWLPALAVRLPGRRRGQENL